MLATIMEKTFLGNSVLAYGSALLILLVGISAVSIIKKILTRKLRAWTQKTATAADDFLVDAIDKKLLPLGYLAVIYLALQGLSMPKGIADIIHIFFALLLTIFGVRFGLVLLEFAVETFWTSRQENEARKHMAKFIFSLGKVILWALAIALLLDNVGIKITPLIAGLGIGGVAVALAAQAILKDLFSCFSIFFDRPFEIGDFIIVGDFLGTVEYIGIKTTRLRSLSGEQVIFSNTDLTNSRVRNYKRMERRRVVFKLGVTYGTTVQQLKEAQQVITGIIQSIDNAVFDRAHFSAYGAYDLQFEVVYYVLSSDYTIYMDIQQEINLRIKEEFKKLGIEFAYPTQTLYLDKE